MKKLVRLHHALNTITTRFYTYTDVTIDEPPMDTGDSTARFSYEGGTRTLTLTVDPTSLTLALKVTAQKAQDIEMISRLFVDVAKTQGHATCHVDGDVLIMTVPDLFEELYLTAQLALTSKTSFTLPKSDVATPALATLYRPQWFTDTAFLDWLNRPDNTLMTWHEKGTEPGEYADLVVWVDPALNGEGDSSDMPAACWREVVQAAAQANGHQLSRDLPHLPVKIVNMEPPSL